MKSRDGACRVRPIRRESIELGAAAASGSAISDVQSAMSPPSPVHAGRDGVCLPRRSSARPGPSQRAAAPRLDDHRGVRTALHARHPGDGGTPRKIPIRRHPRPSGSHDVRRRPGVAREADGCDEHARDEQPERRLGGRSSRHRFATSARSTRGGSPSSPTSTGRGSTSRTSRRTPPPSSSSIPAGRARRASTRRSTRSSPSSTGCSNAIRARSSSARISHGSARTSSASHARWTPSRT